MTARSRIISIIALILALIVGFYSAIFFVPAQIVTEGSLAIPTVFTGQTLKWVNGFPTGSTPKFQFAVPPKVAFFDGAGNNPCSSQPSGNPPSCRVAFGAEGFYPYMFTPGAASSDFVALAQIRPCPGCPGKGTAPSIGSAAVPSDGTVEYSVLCQSGAATSVTVTPNTPVVGSTNSAPGSVVEWLPTGTQTFTLTFDDPTVCKENLSSYGPGQGCTVNKPFDKENASKNSYPYTLTIYTDIHKTTQACTGKPSLTITQ